MGARASADLPSQRAAREHQRGHAVVGGDERVLLVTLACHEKGSLELLHLPRVGCGEQHRGLMRERRDVLIARCRQGNREYLTANRDQDDDALLGSL